MEYIDAAFKILIIPVMMIVMFILFPLAIDYHKYNWASDAEENRVLREIRTLQAKEQLKTFYERRNELKKLLDDGDSR